jgi:acyl dehydratase
MPISWDSIQKGDLLPELKKKPNITQLVKFAAGGGDFNPLHHDHNFPPSKAIGSAIVHGRFKYAALGEMITNWLEHKGYIKKIYCQYRGMDFPDKEMTCKGVIESKWEEDGKRMVELTIWIENEEGKKTTPGSALVVLNCSG